MAGSIMLLSTCVRYTRVVFHLRGLTDLMLARDIPVSVVLVEVVSGFCSMYERLRLVELC